MILSNIEFHGLPDGEVEVRPKGGIPFQLEASHREFISAFIDKLIEKKPIAVDALTKRYAKSRENKLYFEFLMVRGFIKCNFIPLDNTLDIDENGNFNTEYVICPRTGECNECGLICNCPDSTQLTAREIEVLRLITHGYDNSQISELMYLSVNTVHNHRNNLLKKLCKSNTAELVSYWYESGLNKSQQ